MGQNPAMGADVRWMAVAITMDDGGATAMDGNNAIGHQQMGSGMR